MEVLESRETPGLGDKIYKDAAFQENFVKLSVEPEIVTVKKGSKAAANEVEAITGATISSKAIVKIMNNTHKEWISRLPQPGSEPAMDLKSPEPSEQQTQDKESQ
jgi:electron transport complex protein RnfG